MRNKFIRSLCLAALCLVMLASLAACGSSNDTSVDKERGELSISPWKNPDSESEMTETVFEYASDKTIILDAGHGFSDPGEDTPYSELKESDITLSFAAVLSDELTKRGYNVVLTHDGTSFPRFIKDNGDSVYDDKERLYLVNSLSSDLLVSIHCNKAYGDGAESVRGIKLHFFENAAKEINCAKQCKMISDSLGSAFPSYKKPIICADGADEAFPLTANSDTPALLAQIGYLTNPDEVNLMTDSKWQSSLAKAFADGINKYLIQYGNAQKG